MEPIVIAQEGIAPWPAASRACCPGAAGRREGRGVPPPTRTGRPCDAGHRPVDAGAGSHHRDPRTTVVLDDAAFDPSRPSTRSTGRPSVHPAQRRRPGVVGFIAPTSTPPELSVLGRRRPRPRPPAAGQAAPGPRRPERRRAAAGGARPAGRRRAAFTATTPARSRRPRPARAARPTSCSPTASARRSTRTSSSPTTTTATATTRRHRATGRSDHAVDGLVEVGEVSGPGFNPKTTPVLPLNPSALTPDGAIARGSATRMAASKGPVDPLALTASTASTRQRHPRYRARGLHPLRQRELLLGRQRVRARHRPELDREVRLAFDGTNVPQDAFAELTTVQPGTRSPRASSRRTPIGSSSSTTVPRERLLQVQGGRRGARPQTARSPRSPTFTRPTSPAQPGARTSPTTARKRCSRARTGTGSSPPTRRRDTIRTRSIPTGSAFRFPLGWGRGGGGGLRLCSSVSTTASAVRDLTSTTWCSACASAPLNKTLVIEASRTAWTSRSPTPTARRWPRHHRADRVRGRHPAARSRRRGRHRHHRDEFSDTLIELRAGLDRAYEQVNQRRIDRHDLRTPVRRRQIEVGVTDPDA